MKTRNFITLIAALLMTTTIPALADDYTTTAGKLYEDNQSNQARLFKKIGSRKIEVTGTVERITVEDNSPQITLNDSKNIEWVVATIKGKDEPRLADIEIGNKVTLICEEMSDNSAIAFLYGCTFR